MPEGPEVTTITRGLDALLKGLRLVELNELDHKKPLVEGGSLKYLCDRLTGSRLMGVHRIGKNIVFQFDVGVSVLVHLKMTGQLIYDASKDVTPPRFARGRLVFENGAAVFVADKSTWVRLTPIPTEQLTTHPALLEFGPDVLSSEFDDTKLDQALGASGRAVHAALLDQTVLSGLGNIYVNEVLHYSGIDPRTPCRDIPTVRRKVLAYAIKHVMKAAVAHRGTTFSDYRDPYGERGGYQTYLRVFQRDGLPCYRCGTDVERAKNSGRGVFFCPKCQPRAGHAPSHLPELFSTTRTFLFILEGPTSTGKTELTRRAVAEIPHLQFVPSHKTRTRRPTEVSGVDAHFVTHEEFDALERLGSLALTETIYGERYGTSIADIDRTLAAGLDAIVHMAPASALALKEKYGHRAAWVRVLPSDIEAAKRRATTSTLNAPHQRVADLEERMARGAVDADHTITTDALDEAFEKLLDLMIEVRVDTAR